MNQHILKERIIDKINGRIVKTLVFYTFNFEPLFFENYILPIFIKGNKHFSDNIIANQIVWRNIINNQKMPSITVYCDDFVKSNTNAPTLNYDVRCMSLSAKGGRISNFHPKQIVLLLDDNTILHIVGSGNITEAGWCRNIECISIEEIDDDELLSDLKLFMGNVREIKGSNENDIELNLFTSLKFGNSKTNKHFFNSITKDFKTFILENILSKEQVNHIEIISPYLSPTTELLIFLQGYCSNISILLPFIGDDILLDKVTYDCFNNERIMWCDWFENKLSERRNHAKIYRFYGEKKVFTIIGSVNFTTNAWSKFEIEDNIANIENAILYVEDIEKLNNKLLSSKEKDIRGMRFSPIQDEENSSEEHKKWRLVAPNIHFKIDWKNRELIYEIKEELPFDCILKLNSKKLKKEKNEYKFDLDKTTLKVLSKNSMIEIVGEIKKDLKHTFFYYPTNIDFIKKPLNVPILPNQILDYWKNINHSKVEGDIFELLNLIQDAVDYDIEDIESEIEIKVPRLLNEWAIHFGALVSLEKYLAKYYVDRETIEYFLTHQNFNTIPFYLDRMANEFEEGKIYKSFYWTILQIIKQNFYKKYSFNSKQIDNEIQKVESILINKDEKDKWIWITNMIREKFSDPFPENATIYRKNRKAAKPLGSN